MRNLTQLTQLKQLTPFKSAQRGMSFIGLLFVGGILACTGIVIAQVVPRSLFDKNKATGYFDAISSKDLVIEKIADKHVVSFSYQKEIALAGPAYLLMKYEGKTN
jgi:Domain of unknown function (DUF4845)